MDREYVIRLLFRKDENCLIRCWNEMRRKQFKCKTTHDDIEAGCIFKDGQFYYRLIRNNIKGVRVLEQVLNSDNVDELVNYILDKDFSCGEKRIRNVLNYKVI